MRLSEFFGLITEAGIDCREFDVVLAQVDPVPGDSIDVDLCNIGWVEVDFEARQARIFPSSAVTDDTPPRQVYTLNMLLELLPFDSSGDNDLLLVVELPLERDGPGLIRRSFKELLGVHLGRTSEEAWLLLNPKGDFSDAVLPA